MFSAAHHLAISGSSFTHIAGDLNNVAGDLNNVAGNLINVSGNLIIVAGDDGKLHSQSGPWSSNSSLQSRDSEPHSMCTSAPSNTPTYTFKQSFSLQGHDSRCSYTFSPDGERIIHGCAINLLVESYDSDGRRLDAPTLFPAMKANLVRLSSNGERMISIHFKKNRFTMALWDTETGRTWSNPIQASLEENTFLKMSPDCQKVFVASMRTCVLDVTTGFMVGGDRGNGRMSCVAFSSGDGEKIVSVSSDDGRVIVWDTKTAAIISGPHTKYDGCAQSVAISPDGKYIVLGTMDGGISLMEAETGKVLGYFEGHQKCVRSLAFSSDGKCIVSASSDTTVRVWNAETRYPICPPLKGHRNSVVLALFSPDGRRILSHGDDKTIRVWTLAQTPNTILVQNTPICSST